MDGFWDFPGPSVAFLSSAGLGRTGVSTLPRHEQYQLMNRGMKFRWGEGNCAD